MKKKTIRTVYGLVLTGVQALSITALFLLLAFLPFGKIGGVNMPNLVEIMSGNFNFLFWSFAICVVATYVSAWCMTRNWENFGEDEKSFKKYYSKKHLIIKLAFILVGTVLTLVVYGCMINYLGVVNNLFYVLIIIESILYCGVSIVKQILITKFLSIKDDEYVVEKVDDKEFSATLKKAKNQGWKSAVTIVLAIILMLLIPSQLVSPLMISKRPLQFYEVDYVDVYDADFGYDTKFLKGLKFYSNESPNLEEGEHVIEYYSSNVVHIDSIIKELENKLSEADSYKTMQAITKQINEIALIKENLTCGYIYIKYNTIKINDVNSYIGHYYFSIRHLVYDTQKNDGIDVKWGVKNGINSLFYKEEIIMDTEFTSDTDFSTPIPIKVKYSDGSVRLSYVVASNYEELNQKSAGTYKFKWEDEWGRYEKEIKIVNNKIPIASNAIGIFVIRDNISLVLF